MLNTVLDGVADPSSIVEALKELTLKCVRWRSEMEVSLRDVLFGAVDMAW